MYQNKSYRYSKIVGFTRLISIFIKSIFIILCCLAQVKLSHAFSIKQDDISHNCNIKIKSTEILRSSAKINHLPTQGWKKVTLPDNWDKHWKNYTGTAWYKIIWQYQCNSENEFNRPIAIAIDRINMAGEVYSNNQLIWRDPSLVEPLSRSWNMPRYWILQTSTLNHEKNEILVKVSGVHTQAAGLGSVHIGAPLNIIENHKKFFWQNRTIYFINLIITITLGSIGFLIWLLRRKESTFGWFSLTSIFWSLYISNILATSAFPFQNTLQVARVNLIFLMLYCCCFCLFTWRFAGKKFIKIERLFATISIFLILTLLLAPDTTLDWLLLTAFLYSAIIFIVNCVFFQWIAYKKPNTDILCIAFTLLVFFVIALHDLYLLLTKTSDLFLTPFAGPLTGLVIALTLAWRIARNVNHIEDFNQILEQRAQQVSSELKVSLEKKHQLQIDNIRLQERLNLSHELHDGLGGSIVRSMILLDNNHGVIDKRQMMSILKLLRNDLRQVIDSGSSIGVKAPESPIMWGAPIRHRFIQIFEEIEIESKWSFPELWLYKPTTLQCLTLARVAEEALTNVIKHSYASIVKISLIENEQQLILQIQDNGVGFDPTRVQEGLHVGLQSMQVRVNRIGGEFKITSDHKLTIIQAILPFKDA